MGIAWFRAGIWKLRGIRKGLEIGRNFIKCGLRKIYILLVVELKQRN
jgi:hypothetical protein